MLALYLFRRPPPSTLFPYTTLFRSCSLLVPAIGVRTVVAAYSCIAPEVPIVVELDLVRREHVGRLRDPGNLDDFQRHKPTVVRDRKSSRLNSSHRCISYAVFCLKKK